MQSLRNSASSMLVRGNHPSIPKSFEDSGNICTDILKGIVRSTNDTILKTLALNRRDFVRLEFVSSGLLCVRLRIFLRFAVLFLGIWQVWRVWRWRPLEDPPYLSRDELLDELSLRGVRTVFAYPVRSFSGAFRQRYRVPPRAAPSPDDDAARFDLRYFPAAVVFK